MLDLAAIMFSTIVMLIVVLRAVRLDSTEAWFWKPGQQATTPLLKRPVTGTWRRPKSQ